MKKYTNNKTMKMTSSSDIYQTIYLKSIFIAIWNETKIKV